MRSPAQAALVVLALGLVLAVLGGCGRTAAPDPHIAYARSLETFCGAFQRATSHLTVTVTAVTRKQGIDRRARVAALAGGVDAFADAVAAALARFRGVPVPAGDEGFHRAAISGFGAVVGVLHHAAASARGGSRRALLQLRGRIAGTRLPVVPGPLVAMAPTCRAISGAI